MVIQIRCLCKFADGTYLLFSLFDIRMSLVFPQFAAYLTAKHNRNVNEPARCTVCVLYVPDDQSIENAAIEMAFSVFSTQPGEFLAFVLHLF